MKNYFLMLHRLLLLAFITLVISAFQTNSQIKIEDENGASFNLYNKSYALVIGAVNYNNGWPALRGVQKDVEAVKAAFEKQGFTVILVMDPDYKHLETAYRDFINKYGMAPENRLVLYFAGHGHTIKSSYGEEMGYIVPVDAPNPNNDKSAFLTKAMAMQQIEVFAKQIQSKHALFLFDACFSGSIFAVTRAIPENISYKSAKPVRQFISSGSADETVPDESIFRQQLVAGLDGEADLNKDGYITGTELGEFLTDKVINYSKNNQHPQYGKIRNPHLDKGDFIFKSGTEVAASDNYTESSGTTRGSVKDIKSKLKEEIPLKLKIPWQDEFQDMKSIFAKVALRTSNGDFVCAEHGGGGRVIADKENVGVSETFDVIPLGDKKVAFRSLMNKYFSCSDNSPLLFANSDTVGRNETFTIIELDGSKVAFKTWNGKYICAENGGGGEVAANRSKIDIWEVFEFIKIRKAGLKTFNGQFVGNENTSGKIVAKNKTLGQQESFEFVKVNKNKVALKADNGNYLCLSGDNLASTSKSITSNEIFEYIELDNNRFALKAQNDKYVTAVGGGGFGLKADSDDMGDWQKFELVLQRPRKK